MSTSAWNATSRARGSSLVRAKVGDRYVLEAMKAGGYNVGGEQSGHMILLDHATTGDGTVAALQVLARLVRSGKPASDCCTCSIRCRSC
jgi:phosphoglucosamine mutase